MKRWLVLSLTAHALFFWPSKPLDGPVIEIVVVPRATSKRFYKPRLAPTDGEREERQAREESDNGKAQERSIRFSNYIDRIAQNITSPWRTAVTRLFPKLPYRTMYTDVWVKLDKQGRVVYVSVIKSSGHQKLDELCVKVFKNNVFPHPPANLMDRDGYGRLLWRFHVP